jgi:hypothetical protein
MFRFNKGYTKVFDDRRVVVAKKRRNESSPQFVRRVLSTMNITPLRHKEWLSLNRKKLYETFQWNSRVAFRK